MTNEEFLRQIRPTREEVIAAGFEVRGDREYYGWGIGSMTWWTLYRNGEASQNRFHQRMCYENHCWDAAHAILAMERAHKLLEEDGVEIED